MRELILGRRRFVCVAGALFALIGAAGMTPAANYWFESYERAVELIQESRPEEAKSLLSDVIEGHPVPRAAVRVPGNRFITYVPYLQQARIQFQQGNYALAARSLDVSEAFGAVAQDRQQMTELRDLRAKLQAKQLRGEFFADQPAALKVERRPVD